MQVFWESALVLWLDDWQGINVVRVDKRYWVGLWGCRMWEKDEGALEWMYFFTKIYLNCMSQTLDPLRNLRKIIQQKRNKHPDIFTVWSVSLGFFIFSQSICYCQSLLNSESRHKSNFLGLWVSLNLVFNEFKPFTFPRKNDPIIDAIASRIPWGFDVVEVSCWVVGTVKVVVEVVVVAVVVVVVVDVEVVNKDVSADCLWFFTPDCTYRVKVFLF